MASSERLPLLIMAGGTGSRMNLSDKGLLIIRGDTIIGRNLKLLENSVGKVYMATSPNTENTEKFFHDKATIIRTSGEDYSMDVGEALKSINVFPILTIPSDIYFRDSKVLEGFLKEANDRGKGIISLLIEGLFCGVSVFMDRPENVETDDFIPYNVTEKEAYNINTVEDFFLILNRLKKE